MHSARYFMGREPINRKYLSFIPPGFSAGQNPPNTTQGGLNLTAFVVHYDARLKPQDFRFISVRSLTHVFSPRTFIVTCLGCLTGLPMTAEEFLTTDNLSGRRPITPLYRAFVIRSDTLPSQCVHYCSARRILAGVASLGSHVGRSRADMTFVPRGCSEWVGAARRPMQRIPRAPQHPRGAGREKSYDPRLLDFKIPRELLKGGSHLFAPKLLPPPPACCATCATGRYVHKPPRISLCHESRE
jgi:hypothetical protein